MLKREEGYIPVVVAFTPNYFIPVAVCLHSLIQHADKNDRYHFICLLTESISENQQKALESIQCGEGTVIYSFLVMKDVLQGIYINEKYTVAASYRLLLPQILPEHDQVIYMDCDMIVRSSVSAIYNSVDLDNFYLGAVFETPLDFQRTYMVEIGCDPDKYINSGFLIMNLKLLRQDNIVTRFLELAKSDKYIFPDQDILNIVCKGRIYGLSPYCNGIRTFFIQSYESLFLEKYNRRDLENVRIFGTIHYTGDKPWSHYTIELATWWQYYLSLPKAVKCLWKKDINYWRIYFIYLFCDSYLGKVIINNLRKR